MHFNDKSGSPINRVNCEVNTCKFYSQGNQCTAQSIHIQPKNANNSDETDCGTFQMKA